MAAVTEMVMALLDLRATLVIGAAIGVTLFTPALLSVSRAMAQ
jgi:hypothetical protein